VPRRSTLPATEAALFAIIWRGKARRPFAGRPRVNRAPEVSNASMNLRAPSTGLAQTLGRDREVPASRIVFVVAITWAKYADASG